MSEPHTFFGDSVNMRAFVKVAAFNTEILPAEVVGKDEDDVGFLGFAYE